VSLDVQAGDSLVDGRLQPCSDASPWLEGSQPPVSTFRQYDGPHGPIDVGWDDDDRWTAIGGPTVGRAIIEWGLDSNQSPADMARLRSGIQFQIQGAEALVVAHEATGPVPHTPIFGGMRGSAQALSFYWLHERWELSLRKGWEPRAYLERLPSRLPVAWWEATPSDLVSFASKDAKINPTASSIEVTIAVLAWASTLAELVCRPLLHSG
jgi:hypothetical protein